MCISLGLSISTMSAVRCGLLAVIWSLALIVHISVSQSVPQSDSVMSVSEIQERGKVLFRTLRNSDCKVECSGKGRRPVCGSDGVTYASRCDLKRVKRCEKRRVKVRSKGVCSATATIVKTKCMQEREEAQAIARKPTVGIFIPECRLDGSYSETQCHAATGYCWCVTNDGKPIAGTSISGKRPSCKRKSTRGKRRRPQKSDKQKRRPDRRRLSSRRKKRACKSTDRITFNRNLVAAFTQEYQRFETLGQPGSLQGNPVLNSLEKRVVEWKFSQLDRNHDNKLRRREVRSLKRMVKKVIKPRACARNFAKYCDLDQNKRIERREWSICLGVDIKSQQSVRGKTTHVDTKDQSAQQTPEPTMIEEEPELIVDFPTRGNRWSSGLNPRRTNTPAPPSDKEDKTRSCVEERSAAARQHEQDPNGGTFIPACTDDGKWSRAQCHESSQFCWCVNEDTGSPIPGTSTHKIQPSCDMDAEREMKGCPLPKKRRFLNALLEQLALDMDIYVYNGTDPSKRQTEFNPELTVQEKAAKWKFKFLDVNTNNVLERRELKLFRQEIPRRKDTRKCSRNFIRYCDADSNRTITLDEWIDCMGLKSNASFLPDNPNRKGPNPFSHYLKTS